MSGNKRRLSYLAMSGYGRVLRVCSFHSNGLGRRSDTRVIKSFFPQRIIRALRLLAEEQCTWIPGRQGGGYEKIICQLRSPTTHNPTTGSLFASQLVSAEVYRSLCLITNSEARSEAGAASWRHLDEWIRRLPSSAGSDAYFLRCGPGVSVPPHTDPSRPELEHHRLNVVLSTAHEGGDVTIDGEKVEWEPGDALIFRPDLSNHEVSTVKSGQRLIWSVGCVLPVRRGT